MQREIEALFSAYVAGRNKETRVVQELLVVLAVGAAERQRMMRDLAAAVADGEVSAVDTGKASVERSPELNSELAAAVANLRAVRATAAD